MQKLVLFLVCGLILSLLGTFGTLKPAQAGGGSNSYPPLYLIGVTPDKARHLAYQPETPRGDLLWYDTYLEYAITGVHAKPNPYINFVELNVYVDTIGPSSGNTIQAVIGYDFEGDDVIDANIVFEPFILDSVLGLENYFGGQWNQTYYGTVKDFVNGTVYLWIFPVGYPEIMVATSFEYYPSWLQIPYLNEWPTATPTQTSTATRTATGTSVPSATSSPTATATATKTVVASSTTPTAVTSVTTTATVTNTVKLPDPELVKTASGWCKPVACSESNFTPLFESNGVLNPRGLKFDNLNCPTMDIPANVAVDYNDGFLTRKAVWGPIKLDRVCVASIRFATTGVATATATKTAVVSVTTTPGKTTTPQGVFVPIGGAKSNLTK